MGQWYIKGHFGFVKSGLIQLRALAGTVENLLQKEAEAAKRELQNELQKSKPENEPYVSDKYAEQIWELSDVFPNNFRSAVFISCYSFLEHELLDLCKRLKFKSAFRLAPDDLKGKGIFLAQAYLKKVAGIDFPDQSDEWKEIRVYNAIRNMIVHNNGNFLPDHRNAQMVRDYAEVQRLLRIDEYSTFQISSEFVYRVIETIERFLEDLYSTNALDTV